MTQLFDQARVPDPAPIPPAHPEARVLDVDLELDRIFNTAASNELDLTRFSSSRQARRHAKAPPKRDWLRGRLPGIVLVVAGALLGIGIARL